MAQLSDDCFAFGGELMKSDEALALLREDLSLCHTPEEERALEYIGIGLGLTDGGSGRQIAAVDGVPLEDNAAIVHLMRSSVERVLQTAPERGF